MVSYIVKAKHELIDNMIDPVLDSLEEAKAEKKASYQLHLALEEVLVNVVNYAYDGKEGDVEISYDIDKINRYVKVIIKDSGKEFDPTKAEDPKLEGTAKERKIGGLGIYIVKNIVDDIKYSRIEKQNVLEIVKHF